MFSQDDDGQQGLVLMALFGLVAMVVACVIGVAVHKAAQGKAAQGKADKTAVVAQALPPVTVPAAATPADSAATALAQADAASVRVEYGVVKFYFASGRADLASGAVDALADVVKGAKAGGRLVISGFHDSTGDAGKNAALAKQRAIKVSEALTAAGVPAQQIELKKPEQMSGSGSNAEARRVEVALQP